ncbi:MAG TPA: rhomboid family intramembrane serine protease [Caulobacteraceae bacterium]|nr:rhomboid family intramembrane serine protease [Caulobacteraceae bacterium]
MDESRSELDEQVRREPFLFAPWPVVALCLALLVLYALQAAIGTDALIARYGLSHQALAEHRYETLVTYGFLHVGWAHVILNTLGLFIFGPPVARLMGAGPRGVLALAAFYLTTEVLSALGLLAVDRNSQVLVVGASGAVSGLMGAAARLIEGQGRVGPLFGRTVVGFTLVWGALNVILGVFRLTPGAFGQAVAWQAHLAGFFAGLLLIGLFARLAGRGDAAFTH